MFAEKHSARNKIDCTAVNQFLQLPFNFGENLEESSLNATGESVLFANFQIFASRIFGYAAIGGLTMFMQAIVDKILRDVPYAASVLPQAKDKITIATVEIFIIAIKTDAIVNCLLHEQRWMNHITNVPKAENIIIIGASSRRKISWPSPSTKTTSQKSASQSGCSANARATLLKAYGR